MNIYDKRNALTAVWSGCGVTQIGLPSNVKFFILEQSDRNSTCEISLMLFLQSKLYLL